MKITMVDLHGQYERIREEINNAIQEQFLLQQPRPR